MNFPRSTLRAPSLFSPPWASRRKPLTIATCVSATLLQILLFVVPCYLFGVLFHGFHRAHNFNIAFVDFDGGSIGQAVRDAYSELSAKTFVSLEEQPSSQFASGLAVQDAVCRGDYWGAIYVESGASQELADHIAGKAAGTWNASSAATAVNMGVRFATAQQGYVQPGYEALFTAARAIWVAQTLTSTNATAALATLAPVIAMPISYSAIDLAPLPQGTYAFLNTAVTVFIVLLQFFSILAFNGIWEGFGVYTGASIRSHLSVRFIFSVLYALVGSLLMTALVFAFKESWDLDGRQFGETWMLLWLSMHVHWLVFDVYRANVPMSAIPFFTFFWIIVNLASTVMPFELSPGFYKIGYMWPAYNTWEGLIHIWSGGCYNRLYRNLPILFAWWLASFALDYVSQVRKSNKMAKASREQSSENTDHNTDQIISAGETPMESALPSRRPSIDAKAQ